MLFVIQLFHLQVLLAVFSRWTASDANNLLVLLKIFSCFFSFHFDPISLLFPSLHTVIFFQPQISLSSTPNMTATGSLKWTGILFSSPSLPSPYISPVLTTLLVPSPIFPIAPLSSCIRGHILLNPSFMLFLLKTTAFHRKYREEGLFSSGFPAMLAGCLPVLFQPTLETLTGIKNAFAFSKCKS